MDAERRLQRVEEQIFSLLPEWTLRPVVDALQAMRGIAPINVVAIGSRRCEKTFAKSGGKRKSDSAPDIVD
jgi:hypothetical protein